ncbi:MAG: hypothetical protein ABIP93_06660 [Gemmatimonadaceae bacterium]
MRRNAGESHLVQCRGHRRERGAPAFARSGVALLTTLALLALAAALLAGAFAAATASARAARSARASLVAAAAARRALASTLTTWSGAEDRLAVGDMFERAGREPTELPLDAAETRVRVLRLSATLFVVAADVAVPATATPLARRRMRLLVQRSPVMDSSIMQAPRAIARWPLGELY